MVTVSDSTIRANVFETCYDILNAASLTPSTVSVYAAYTDSSAGGTFPQIVINPVDVDYDNYGFGSTSRYNDKTVKVLVDIWTKKNKDRDTLADGVVTAFNTTSSWDGVHLVSIGESSDFSPQNENKLHVKSITLTFMRR